MIAINFLIGVVLGMVSYSAVEYVVTHFTGKQIAIWAKLLVSWLISAVIIFTLSFLGVW